MKDEKLKLEVGALNQFAASLTFLWGKNRFLFCELRSPPEPDSICTIDGEPVHVEVCHIYGTPSDAKQLLGRTGKSAPTSNEKLQSRLIPLNVRFLSPLNRLLAEKATRTYIAPRVWLLVRFASPLWNLNDFEEHRVHISIPSEHPFEQIWLLCGPRVSSGVFRLA